MALNLDIRKIGTPRSPVGDKARRQRRSAPLLTVSVGTAGADRNARFLERMSDAGQVTRVQSALFYDYNENTTSKLWQRFRLKKSNSRNGNRNGIQVHMPKTIRNSDGFLLNPYAFGEYLGIIDHDMKELIDDICSQAHAKSQPPQLIVEFLGFGGHANLGLLLHRKIRDAFPEARVLPILALPDDPTLQEWMRGEVQEPTDNNTVPASMRDGTWKSYERLLTLRKHEGCLLVANWIDKSPNDDLAMGLATIEAAADNSMKSGSLPEAVAGIRINDRGWMGMNVVQKVLPSRQAWSFSFPMRRLRPVWGSDDELAVQVKMAVKQCLTSGSLLEEAREDPDMPSALGASRNGYSPNGQALVNGSSNGSANGHGNHNGSATPPPVKGARVYVSVPLPDHLVPTLKSNVLRQLQAERFEEQFGRVNISFGPVHFPERAGENNRGFQPPDLLPITVLKNIGKLLIFPVYAGRYLLFGGKKEQQIRQLKAVAVALYPITGEVPALTKILKDTPSAVDAEPQYQETSFGHYSPTTVGGYTVPAEAAETLQPASNGAAHDYDAANAEAEPEPARAIAEADAEEEDAQPEATATDEGTQTENGAVHGEFVV